MNLEIRGLDYNVVVEGDPARERTAVLLHGFTGSSEDWRLLMPVLRHVGLAVVAPDLPGHGLTGLPESAARYALDETARDLDLLRHELGIESAVWLGYSMGGRVALHYALAHPTRVRSLVLESTSPGIADPASRGDRRRADDLLADRIEERGMAWFADYWSSLPLFETQWDLPLATRNALRARRERNRPAGLAGSLRGMGQGAHEYMGERLEGLGCRMLLIAGERDLKYVNVARQIAESIPNATCLVVPGVGHTVHLEAPDVFAQACAVHCIVSEGADSAASVIP
jgi:2-succinyl-6-hydroxy-2,4-cyclohexadiene-1-carboxylate synthase